LQFCSFFIGKEYKRKLSSIPNYIHSNAVYREGVNTVELGPSRSELLKKGSIVLMLEMKLKDIQIHEAIGGGNFGDVFKGTWQVLFYCFQGNKTRELQK
jgi:hypothetical protein